MIPFTVYANTTTPEPFAREALPWGEVVASLRELVDVEAPAKTALPAFAPHRLRDGTARAAANVDAVTLAVVDVDRCDVDELDAALERLGVAAVVYGSPSDDAAAAVRRVRVVAPMTREVAPGDCAALRFAFAEALGLAPGAGVEGAPEAARLFFCGRVAGTPPRAFAEYGGHALDVDALLAAPLRHAWHAPAPAPTAAPSAPRGGDPARDAAASALLAAIGPCEALDGRKHAICGALGGILRRADWTQADAAALVRAWLTDDAGRPRDGVRDVEAGVRWATAAWSQLAEDVSGMAALERVVGERVASIVWEASQLPRRSRGAKTDADAGQGETGTADAAAPVACELRIIDRTQPPPTLEYVVPALDLAPGKVSAIQGFAYTAKTPFALLLAICIASGVDFLGCPVVQRPTLYVDFEGGVLTQEREARICAGLHLDRAAVPLTLAQADVLSAPLIDEVERRVERDAAGVVVIDTYSSALPADVQTFNDAGFRVWATSLARLGERTGAMIVLLVHENKGASGKDGLRGISGHGSLAGAVQSSIALSRPKASDSTLIGVACARAARNGFKPFAVRWRDVDDDAAPTGSALVAERVGAAAPDATRAAPRDMAARAALARAAGEAIVAAAPVGVWVARKEVVALGGGNRNAALEAIARLTRGGVLQYRAGEYALTEGVGAVAVAAALGASGGFTR